MNMRWMIFVKRMKRSERLGIILLILAKNPNRLFTLSQLAQQFGCAKSTLSEDMTEIKAVLARYNLGLLETSSGASGGICYLPFRSAEENLRIVHAVCEQLSDPKRIMPGGFLYTVDLFSNPDTVHQLGMILAQRYYEQKPDVIVTIESKGIPIGLMVAQAMGKQLVIARKENRATEGSVVTLNYFTASSKVLSAMSLPRRALKEGQRALIVDDFVKGGGTIRGLCDMMQEFHCDVVGTCALIRMPSDQIQQEGVLSLLELEEVDVDAQKVRLRPSAWLHQAVQ